MSRRPSLPSPAEVASGRVRATLEQLFALIAEVNPTDLALAPGPRAERYALKARLQSLLIRQHAHALRVEPHPGDDRVISLRHRVGDRDACHAMVAALDADARRWVEAELTPAPEAAPEPGSQAPPPPAAPAPGGPLERGRAALADYDFEEAERCFVEGFERSGGDVEAARLLLDLLVNHLVDDPGALALAKHLSPGARSDGAVMGALALAAARTGDRARAEDFLRLATGEAALTALVALADGALRDGDSHAARASLSRLATLDGANPAIARLRAGLERLRADERGPLESALAAACSANDWLAAEALSRQILARWPESELAQRTQRALEERERENKIRTLVERAREALGRNDCPLALSLSRQLRALGALAESEPIDADARLRTEDIEAERVRQSLRGDASAANLSAYLALSPRCRERLRDERPETAWLSALPEAEARVQAVCALAEARDALQRGDLRGAACIEPYAWLLRALPDGRDALDELASLRESLVRQTREAILEARQAGRPELGLSLVSALPIEERRATKAELEADIHARALRERLVNAERDGELLLARDLAARLGDAAQVAQLSRQLRELWRIEVHEGVDIGTHNLIWDVDAVLPLPWLTADGSCLIVVQTLAEWVFVRTITLETMTVSRVIVLKAPHSLELSYSIVEDDSVTLVDRWAALLQLRLSDGEVLRFFPRPPGMPLDNARPDGAMVAQGGRYVWLPMGSQQGYQLRIYDTEHWPSFREMDEPGLGVPLLGSREPWVFKISPTSKGGRLCAPHGGHGGRRPFFPNYQVRRAVAHPEGVPVCVLADLSAERETMLRQLSGQTLERAVADPLGLVWHRMGEGKLGNEIQAVGSVSQPHQIAAAVDEGVLYVKVGPGGLSLLSCYRVGGAQSEGSRNFGRWAPTTLQLFTDARSRRVRALARLEDGVHEVPPEENLADPKGLDAQLESRLAVWPDGGLDFDLECAFSAAVCTENGAAIAKVMAQKEPKERTALLESLLRHHHEEPDALCDLASVLLHLGETSEGVRVFEDVHERFESHPRLRLNHCGVLSALGDWTSVQEKLEGVDLGSMESAFAQHAFHLRAVARLRAGDLPGARQDIVAATARVGQCKLLRIAALLDILAGVEEPLEATDTPSYLFKRLAPLVRGLWACDERLGAGDPAGALAALDDPLLWLSGDRQTAARAAEAWLQLPSTDARTRLLRRLALANFVATHERYKDGRGHDVPVPGHIWDNATLDALAVRVRDSLDEVSEV